MAVKGRQRQHLPYLSWHADAERRHKRGERQLYCGECVTPELGGWVWPDECDHPGRLTARGFRDMVRWAKKDAARYDTDAKRYKRALRELRTAAGSRG